MFHILEETACILFESKKNFLSYIKLLVSNATDERKHPQSLTKKTSILFIKCNDVSDECKSEGDT